MKASDNQFPSVTLEEVASDGSDLTNPAADHRRLFLGEDGALHLRDSSGTVTDIGGGDVATDAIWDAKGDLAVGTGANTAQKLTVGVTDGHVLTIDSGETTGLKWAAVGTSSGDALVPERTQSNTTQGSTQNPTCAFGSNPSATSLILVAAILTGRAASGVPTLTGVTFVEIEDFTDGSDHVYLWAGTGTASAATVTVSTGSNNYYCISILAIEDPGVTPTAGTVLSAATASPHRHVEIDGLTAGRLVAAVRGITNSSLTCYSDLSIPAVKAKQPSGCTLHAAFVPSGGSFDITTLEGSSSGDGVYIAAEIV